MCYFGEKHQKHIALATEHSYLFALNSGVGGVGVQYEKDGGLPLSFSAVIHKDLCMSTLNQYYSPRVLAPTRPSEVASRRDRNFRSIKAASL